jgi:epoxide hydrolase
LPGSVLELVKVIGALTDPVAHGGRAKDAFALVPPSIRGYGLLGRPMSTRCRADRITRAWAELMCQLGYQRRRVSGRGFRRTAAMRDNYGTGAV